MIKSGSCSPEEGLPSGLIMTRWFRFRLPNIGGALVPKNPRIRESENVARFNEVADTYCRLGEGFRCSFWSSENAEPIHVHVCKAGANAKSWIEPGEKI